MIVNKEIRKLLEPLVFSGIWNIRIGKKHIILTNTNTRKIISISKTPSDSRAIKNIKSCIKRCTEN